MLCKHVQAVQRATLATGPNQQDMCNISNEPESISSHVKVTTRVQTTQIKESMKGTLVSLEYQIELCDNLHCRSSTDIKETAECLFQCLLSFQKVLVPHKTTYNLAR